MKVICILPQTNTNEYIYEIKLIIIEIVNKNTHIDGGTRDNHTLSKWEPRHLMLRRKP